MQGRVADDTIDLHGQFVEEAEDILEARIRDAQARGQTHLHVIVGKGNHSAGHVQKIKPRVEQICQEMGLHYATEENEGRMYVDLTGGKVSAPPPLPAQPGGYQGGYHTSGGQGYQQPHHGGQQYGGQQYQQQPQQGYQPQPQYQQQSQQQQQGDEIEQMVEDNLPKLCKNCCAIM